jgi:hypothetical protein
VNAAQAASEACIRSLGAGLEADGVDLRRVADLALVAEAQRGVIVVDDEPGVITDV